MIKNIVIGKVVLEGAPFVPPLLAPLIFAAAAGDRLEPVLNAICAHLGFDSFMFGMSTSTLITHEAQIYAYTTLPVEWVVRYDQMDYVEIDPRIRETQNSRVPFVWDYASQHGRDPITDAFLEDAAANGIGSGLAFEFNDHHYLSGFMALNSTKRILDGTLRESISRNLGTILLLGGFFQKIFRKAVIEQRLVPTARNTPLSPRQRQCLELAAHGLTTEDIAFRLNISTRTAQFHFDCIRAKLNAANRQEAIAKGLQTGSIELR
jgi:DNA-binding CsgD family transcriptional regulator